MKATKTTKPLRIKKISVNFEFDERYVEKCNLFATNYATDVFERLRAKSIRRAGWGHANCLLVFGTWSLGKEIRIGKYNCASTMVTIENVWNEKSSWCKDRAAHANKILRECPDVFIRDFAIGTIGIIDAIKNDERFKEAEFRVTVRISYTGTGARSKDCTGLFYDSKDGFIYWD